MIEKPNFMDFLSGGWILNLNCAIDFTSSNGEIQDPKSLHFQNPNQTLNDYENAIVEVGTILDYFSNDKKYFCVGFGGKPRSSNSQQVSHCFPLNPDGSYYAIGQSGIIEAY